MEKRSGRLVSTVAVLVLAIGLAACQPATPAPTATSIPTVEPTSSLPAEPTAVATPTPLVLEGAVTTDSGLQYLEIEEGDGKTPQAGDIITMHYIASLPDGTELANSYSDDKPITTVWGFNNLLPGWEEAVGLMKVNGKSKIVLSPELAFGADGAGMVPPNSQVVIEMELLSSKPAPVPEEVAESDLNTTDSGLQYYDIETGTGAEAVDKSGVTTDYTIWVKTDEGYNYIASSEGAGPMSFNLGSTDAVFPGWNEGVTGMKVGGKRLLVIPPELGLGEQGFGAIPPNATLVMEVGLSDVREPRLPTEVDEKDYTTTESGLKYYDLVEGTGDTPEAGQTVVVDYTGWLEDGTQFDSSINSGSPFSFALGTGGVIPGWDEGIATMKVGGKRQLVVPAELGYGDQGAGGGVIPPGAKLIFEVELLSIQP